jgi:hypothetical protein
MKSKGSSLGSAETQDMDDRSKKSATRQQVFIVNDLAGNKNGNKGATDRQHFSSIFHHVAGLSAFSATY